MDEYRFRASRCFAIDGVELTHSAAQTRRNALSSGLCQFRMNRAAVERLMQDRGENLIQHGR